MKTPHKKYLSILIISLATIVSAFYYIKTKNFTEISLAVVGSRCGDGICQPELGERCYTCPADCGYCGSPPSAPFPPPSRGYCGNGVCDSELGESCTTCPDDCLYCGGSPSPFPPPAFCGDGICNSALGEDCYTCSTDCGRCPCTWQPVGECGWGPCIPEPGAVCWGIACGCVTSDGTLIEVICTNYCPVPSPSPSPGYCGDGFCDSSLGETCDNCSVDCGTCAPSPGSCGNGICDPDESCFTCPTDCGRCSSFPLISVSLTANPNPIRRGQSSTLSWTISGARGATCMKSCISGDCSEWNGSFRVRTADSSGSQVVTPSRTSTYRLTCTDLSGSAYADETIIVTSIMWCPGGQ